MLKFQQKYYNGEVMLKPRAPLKKAEMYIHNHWERNHELYDFIKKEEKHWVYNGPKEEDQNTKPKNWKKKEVRKKTKKFLDKNNRPYFGEEFERNNIISFIRNNYTQLRQNARLLRRYFNWHLNHGRLRRNQNTPRKIDWLVDKMMELLRDANLDYIPSDWWTEKNWNYFWEKFDSKDKLYNYYNYWDWFITYNEDEDEFQENDGWN